MLTKYLKTEISFLFLILILSANALAVNVYVDSWKIESSTPSVVVDGQVLAPAQDIFSALGATATLDPVTSSVLAIRGETQIWIQADNPTAFVSGAAYTLAVPAQLINGQLMIPVQFVSEALNCDYTWDAGTQTAAVANILKGVAIYDTSKGARWHIVNPCNQHTYYPTTLAEALGLGLTPCQKCVLSSSQYSQLGNQSPPASSATTATTTSPTAPATPSTMPPAVQTTAPEPQPSAPAQQQPAPALPTQTTPAPVPTQAPPMASQQPAPTQAQQIGSQRNHQRQVEEPLWLIVDTSQAPEIARPQVTATPNSGNSLPGTPSWIAQ